MRTPLNPTGSIADVGGNRIHYQVDGREGAPWLVFCNSLGTDLTMWHPQVAALGGHFRILRYDRRGHGRSGTPPGPYSMADLGRDVIGLMDALGIERAHFCGLSIGGLVGQWLALNAPARIERLVLASTAAKIGTADGWQARAAQVRGEGMEALAEATVERWFSPAFAVAAPDVVAAVVAPLRQVRVEGYAGCCAALAGADFRDDLGRIEVPVLAIAGDDDPVTTPSDLRHIAEGVADGRCVELPGRHICNVESAPAFSTRLEQFLLA